jgi:hypothetical protein
MWFRRTRSIGRDSLRRRITRRLVRAAIVAVLLVIILPTVFIAATCSPVGQARQTTGAGGASTAMAAYRRAEAFTYLTLPEWFVVYNADEYGRFTERGSPSDFPYFSSISQYWGYYASVCSVTRTSYPFDTGSHVMLGIIGASYTVEYVIKGLYENTVGRITARLSGRETPEDAFAAKTALEYAALTHTAPWYEFPFGSRLMQLWTEVPVFGPHGLRKFERRAALTLEYSVKAASGGSIALAMWTVSGGGDRKVQVHVDDATDAIFRDPLVEKVREAGEKKYIVRLPRDEPFTRAALTLLDARVRFLDVAGNDTILVTVLAAAPFNEHGLRGIDVIASLPIPTDDQRKRVALRVPVTHLHEVIPALRGAGATIEHLYDY